MSHGFEKLFVLISVAATFTTLGCSSIIEPSSTYDIPRAVTVPTVAANGIHFASVTSGFFHSCALDVNGEAWCWGDNLYRQTGQTRAGDSCDQVSTCIMSPAAVNTTLRFAQISAGVTQTCAIAVGGGAWCWGGGYGNGQGILGDGKMSQSAVPVAVLGGATYESVSVGGRLACALSADGRVYCWGSGGYVGDGRTSDALSPVEVAGDRRYIAVAAGVTHACAVTIDHAMYCWGSNQLGELGIGSMSADPGRPGALSPVPVVTSLKFVSVTAGGNDTCGLTDDGRVACWGDNHVGELGSGQPGDPQTLPTPMTSSTRFISVAAGTVHTCGISSDGTALCWGGNWFGGLGVGTSTAANTGSETGLATPVKTLQKFTQIAAGGSHTCALATDLRLWCWGDGGRAQMGDGRD